LNQVRKYRVWVLWFKTGYFWFKGPQRHQAP
jgi:hypothetical protein